MFHHLRIPVLSGAKKVRCEESMVRPKGFEPLTPRFVVWCSIQLSYGRNEEEPLRAVRS